jgi:hypothetical protein
MKNRYCFIIFTAIAVGFSSCYTKGTNAPISKAKIKAEIEQILQIQEEAYDQNDEQGRLKIASTCEDSLLFVGGDNGGLATSSDYYVHDLADGYSQKPHDKIFRIYDQTVIVTSIHQSYKTFGKDTIYFNGRSTKVFVRNGKTWKMAYVTYAPLPVIYTKPDYSNAEKFLAYEGLYEQGSTVDTVSVANGKLYMNAGGPGKSELLPINDSTFMGKDYFGKTVFARNSAGVVTQSYFEFPDGQRLVFRKIK